MSRLGPIALLLILSGTGALAEPPATSLRPQARPVVSNPAPVPAPAVRERKGLFGFLRPIARASRQKGQICGNPALQGEKIGRVLSRHKGCGVTEPIRLRAVSGVRLSQSAIMDCGTAQALHTWVTRGMKPVIGDRGGGVAEITVAAHYICRSRNNQKGARISEHGRGRAIDVSGFLLRDGSRITVLEGWKNARDAKPLRQMHKAACGPFGTVLGPNSDRFHRDHFHFDTARYRSGSYCR